MDLKLNMQNIAFDLKYILYPIIYIIIGTICYNIIQQIIKKFFNKRKNQKIKIQRIETLTSVILNIIKYIIVILVTVSILATYGINVSSIMAGLGITTAIIGLAFQDLAKDIIAGFFIITEGQYEVGDTIEIDGFMGEVIFLGLKTTRVKNYKGQIKIIANRYMDNIINYSLNNSLAIVDINFAYEEDIEKVEKVLNELIQKYNGKIKDTKGSIELLGITELGNSSIVIRLTVETTPMQQYTVERFLRKEIKRAFDEANIKIPYPQIEVHNGK